MGVLNFGKNITYIIGIEPGDQASLYVLMSIPQKRQFFANFMGMYR